MSSIMYGFGTSLPKWSNGKDYFTDRKMTKMIPISFPRHLMRFVTVRYEERWELEYFISGAH